MLFCCTICLYLEDLILKIFNEFGSISGYKINCNKCNLLLLNNRHVASTISLTIQTKSKITYLGIHASLQRVVQDNYETRLSSVQRDLANWSALPASLRSRIAAVKINIVTMIPLPPPINVWKKKGLAPFTPRIDLVLQRCRERCTLLLSCGKPSNNAH